MDGCKCSVRLRRVWIHEELSLSLMCSRPRRVATRGVAGLLPRRGHRRATAVSGVPHEVSSYEALIRIAHAPPVASRPFGLCEASCAGWVCRRPPEPSTEPLPPATVTSTGRAAVIFVLMSKLLSELPVSSTDETKIEERVRYRQLSTHG